MKNIQYYRPYKFKRKSPQWVDADAAIRTIRKGKRILIGSGCAIPQYLVDTLAKNAPLFRDNEILHILTVGQAPYADPVYARAFRHNALFIGHNVRNAVSDGHADYTPIFLSEIPNLFKTRQLPLHCALIQVTAPNKRGQVSLGVSVDVLLAAIAHADVVIAQVNPLMPWTCGPAVIPVTAIDYLVEKEEALKEFPQGQPDEVSMQIGRHLSRYINDGDTLQLGIGNIPDAVLMNLSEKNDLGLHTEMISDGVAELYQKGVITNKKKGIHKGKSVLSFILGSRKTFDVVDHNPDFQFYPTEYCNDPFVICQNRNMVSINSCLQIDLTGQVCSDSLGAKFYSGFGGQVDFVRGARRSPGGRSFIAFPSTAKDGAVSRIVPFLDAGAGVVTSRADVHYVVTEYGVAYLHGKNIRERGLSLIQIAHPKFRDELLDYLKQKHYVYLDQKTIKDDHSPVHDSIPYSETFKGKTVYFRPLRPHDEKALQDFFYSHKPETIYQRYLTRVEAMPHEEAQARVTVDYNKDMVLAGFDSPQPYAQMVCIGRYIQREDRSAVAGLVVKEDYQGIGIGTFLAQGLLKAAKEHGITALIAYVGAGNQAMIRIYEKQGFQKKLSPDGEKYECFLQIKPEAADPAPPTAARVP